jgi:hypothetical protein
MEAIDPLTGASIGLVSEPIDPLTGEPRQPISIGPDKSRNFVTDDGRIVILGPQAAFGGSVLRVFTKDGRMRSFGEGELLAGFREKTQADELEALRSDTIFELLLDSEEPPIFALWEGFADKWAVLSPSKPCIPAGRSGPGEQAERAGADEGA